MRCIRLPPTVAMLRSCGEAPARIACDEQRIARARPPGRRRRRCSSTSAPRRSPPSGELLDPRERQAADIDQRLGPLDVLLHQVDQVRAAGDELARRRAAAATHRVRDVARRGRSRSGFIGRLPLCAITSLDRRDDIRVGAAAAEVAAHRLADLVARPGVAFADQADGRADLAGRAVAALEGVVVDEGLLQRVKRVALGEGLRSSSPRPVVHDREGQAAVDAPAVDQHGAGAALPVVTALLGAGEVGVLAQRSSRVTQGSIVARYG